ncbi:MAG: flagellar assembly protein FliW [Microterricola sp.]
MSATLSFIAPPPGFEPSLEFDFSAVDDTVGLFTLSAVDGDSRRVFVLDAGIYLPEYTPSLSQAQSESLGLTSGDDARVYVVANPAESGTTVNLLAPIVVNAATNAAAQVILDDRDWPLQAPLGA